MARSVLSLSFGLAVVASWALAGSGCDQLDDFFDGIHGRDGGGGAVACGKTTCAAGQVCCNASCGICVATGGGCTQQICTALSWTYTCGRSICVNTDAGATDGGSSLPPCTADQKLNGPCPTLGQMCDPRDNSCGRMFVCATGPMPCPL